MWSATTFYKGLFGGGSHFAKDFSQGAKKPPGLRRRKCSHVPQGFALEDVDEGGQRDGEGEEGIEERQRHVAVEEAADDGAEGHAEVEADVVGAVGEAAFFGPGDADGGGLADGAHEAVAAGHEAGGDDEQGVAVHLAEAGDTDEGADGAEAHEEAERLAVEEVGHGEAQRQEHDGVERKEEPGMGRQAAGGDIADEEALGGAVRDGEEHDDGGHGQHAALHELEGFLAAAGGGSDFAFVGGELDEDDDHHGEGGGDDEGAAVADGAIEADAQRRRDGHGEGVHGAVEAHAGADALLGQEAGDPGGHADAAEGEADAVDDAGGHDDTWARRADVADAGEDHQRGADGGKAVFADLVGEVADEGPAAERDDVHHAADEAHEHGAGAEALGKASDERRHEHGTGHVEEAGGHDQADIAGHELSKQGDPPL